MDQLDASLVGTEEVDSLGYLDVRIYLARVDRASSKVLGALGVSDCWIAWRHATLRRVDAQGRGPDGGPREDFELMFLMIRHPTAADAKSFGPPVLYTDDAHSFGWAMLEARSVEVDRPHAGNATVWLGADIPIDDEPCQMRGWAFVESTDRLLGIHDSVGIAMDLDARQAIEIARSIRMEMYRHHLPRYA